MSEQSPLNAVDIRKVTNGYVVRFVRLNDAPPMMSSEERVFYTWLSLVSFLEGEGFILQ